MTPSQGICSEKGNVKIESDRLSAIMATVLGKAGC